MEKEIELSDVYGHAENEELLTATHDIDANNTNNDSSSNTLASLRLSQSFSSNSRLNEKLPSTTADAKLDDDNHNDNNNNNDKGHKPHETSRFRFENNALHPSWRQMTNHIPSNYRSSTNTTPNHAHRSKITPNNRRWSSTILTTNNNSDQQVILAEITPVNSFYEGDQEVISTSIEMLYYVIHNVLYLM
jgi:hypothetical protein